jgi:integrase
MARGKRKITKRVVDTLTPDPAGRDIICFDTKILGFGVRVKPSGAKSYILKYRNKYGQQRKYHIAAVGPGMTPEQAREEAEALRGRIVRGGDPAAEKKADRSAIKVADLADEYLTAAKGRIKASTWAVDKSRIERHVKPLLGSRPVTSLTPRDMEKFLRDIETGKSAPKEPAKGRTSGKRAKGGQTRGGSAVASRTVSMLGTILERAVRDGTIPKNPVRGVKRPKDRAKRPPFSFDAVAAVGTAMRELEAAGENVTGLRAVRFLLMTGTRRMEALTLKWGMVDRRAHCLRFADTKSGPQTRPAGRAALDLLASFEPEDAKPSDYVFPSDASKAGYLVGLPKVWRRVAKHAGISGVSIHGLRHWFASAAAEMNFSELTIAGLLGHTVKGVTARYANAPDSALIAAADHVSQRLADALDGRAADNVINFTGARNE